MATIIICDMCGHAIPVRSGAKIYFLSIQLHSGPVARNESHPTLNKEICKDCAKKIKDFVVKDSAKSSF